MAKRFLSSALKHQGMAEKLLQTLQSSTDHISAQGFGYIANAAKDYGALEGSAILFQEAIRQSPDDPTYVLSLVHVYESRMEFQRGIAECFRYLNQHVDLAVSDHHPHITSKALLDASKKSVSKMPSTPLIADDEGEKGIPHWCSDWKLDYMGILFTLVKMMFIEGDASSIVPLVELIEQLRHGWEFHQTSIRNEHAYYCCAVQLLSYHNIPMVPLAPLKRMYVVGDSHCLPLAWHTLGKDRLMEARLITGCKMWHLRPEGLFFPKVTFELAMESLPEGSDVMMVLGEIDCREGLLVCIEKARYKDLAEAASTVIDIFVEELKKWIKRKKFNIYIHPVAPVLDVTRHIVYQFNTLYEAAIEKQDNMHWIDIFKHLIVEKPKKQTSEDSPSLWNFNAKYALDGTHMNPEYIPLLEKAINTI